MQLMKFYLINLVITTITMTTNNCNNDSPCPMMRMVGKKYVWQWFLYGLLIIIGGIGGYMYYKLVGCSTGACPLQSNPWFTILWGALAGYIVADTIILITNMIKKKKKGD